MFENRGIKLVATEKRNYLVSEPNYHTAMFSQKICWL